MKAILRGILTIWIFILLVIFGISSSIKDIMIDTVDAVVKNELKTNIIESSEKFLGEKISNDAIERIEKEIDENPKIKEIMNKYYDDIMNVLSNSDATIQIDIASELETLIDDCEEYLKEYDITFTSEQKEELISIVSSSEINDLVNESLAEVKNNMDSNVIMAINIYNFVTSMTFKVILTALIAIALLFIALLKKSFYGWLSNFGIASIITGALIITLSQIIIKFISDEIAISLESINLYSYIILVLGIISIVANLLIKIIVKKQQIPEVTE